MSTGGSGLNKIKSNESRLYISALLIFFKLTQYYNCSKHLISLSSSDSFAVRWFYDELVVRYSLIKSNLNKSDILKSNEENYLNDKDDNLKNSEKLNDFMNQMNAEISEKRKKEISKQMKFDRCSSGEY